MFHMEHLSKETGRGMATSPAHFRCAAICGAAPYNQYNLIRL